MSPTARIVKDLHVHKLITKMVMTYRDESNKAIAIILEMKSDEHMTRAIRTLRWASHRGIEVTFRPV